MPMCLDENQFMNMGFNTLSHTKKEWLIKIMGGKSI